ncbi:MAG TPA: N-acetylmuramoyl-L-alanine amidase [Thermoanaerobaculia bacterium]|jgi:hypothetical protein
MKITDYPLEAGQFFPTRTTKRYVVWHGTAGRTESTPVNGKPGKATTSIDGWNRDALHVGAPWLVDRDGTVYRTFDDRNWIYHLGIKGTNGRYDKASVAIEFANELALDLDQGRMHAFGFKTPNTIYNGPYLTREWRGSRFFAVPDEEQIDAGIELTLDICRRHKIDPVFYYPSTMFNYPRCFEVATILCHSNCRADKTDFCFPDWVYQKIEAAGIRLQS